MTSLSALICKTRQSVATTVATTLLICSFATVKTRKNIREYNRDDCHPSKLTYPFVQLKRFCFPCMA